MNKKQKITLFISILFIIAGLAMINTNKTEYATIKGESFTIPKVEGEGWFYNTERGE